MKQTKSKKIKLIMSEHLRLGNIQKISFPQLPICQSTKKQHFTLINFREKTYSCIQNFLEKESTKYNYN